jgi:hypothetical protein
MLEARKRNEFQPIRRPALAGAPAPVQPPAQISRKLEVAAIGYADMADIRAARAAVKERVLDGDGHASRADRKAAFANDGVPEAARALVDKVANRAAQIDDSDIAAAKTAGLTEDQIFELVVCAAIGQSSRQYDSALAALAEATETK